MVKIDRHMISSYYSCSQYCGHILKYLAGDWDLFHGFGKVGQISESGIACVNSPYHLRMTIENNKGYTCIIL